MQHTADVSQKTSGFGIGELGQTPPQDSIAILTPRQSQPPKFKFVIVSGSFKGKEHTFTTLAELIDFSRRNLRQDFEYRWANVSLCAPGYTVGHMGLNRAGDYELVWREMLPTNAASPGYCEECGGTATDGKCETCGETDMIAYPDYTWDNHHETLRNGYIYNKVI
jgi:hypothetical protein